MTMTAPVSIPQVVIHHFDAFQQKLLQSGEDCDAAEVQARATLICRELEKFIPTNNNDSLQESEDSEEEQEDDGIHQVTATLLECVDHCMAADVSNKDDAEIIHGVLELVACVAAQFHSKTTIPALVSRAIQYSSSIMERVRILACKLLGLSVYYSPQQEQDETESVEAACKTLIARLTDKSQAVRNAAICASSFFFTSSISTKHDVLLESLLWNMAHDPSAANRIAALESIPVYPNSTLDDVIARVRDEKVKVRVQALEILSLKANGLASCEQYAQIVRSSLGNRCTATSQAASRMICASWMKFVRFDPIALIGLVDPVLHEPECTKVCRVLFQVAQEESPVELQESSLAEIRAFRDGVTTTACTILVKPHAIDAFLEPRAVLFCNTRCAFLASSTSTLSQAQGEVAIAKIVPDVVQLCTWLQLHLVRLVESIQNENDEESTQVLQEQDVFVCTQLLQLAQATDLKEEGSRRHFIAAMKTLLGAIETPDELLEGSIQALGFAHSKESDFLQTISDVISQLSTLYTRENDNDETDDGILQHVSTLRIITILAITLENTSANMASDSIIQGFSFYIVPAITSCHALVREGGVSCLGRLAMLSDSATVVEEFKPLLLSVASNQKETLEIRAQAIMAICDLSFLFSEMLESQDGDGVSFVPLLVELLGTSKPAVVAVAAEIAAKLLFAGRTCDSHLLANLVVTYFDQDLVNLENDEEDDHDVLDIGSPVRMQQLLSLFFPAYGMLGTKCKSALVSCMEPMLDAVVERLTQKGVKASDWSMTRMVEYVESLLECSASAVSDNDQGESSVANANKEEEEEEEGANTTSIQDKDESPSPQEPNYYALVAIQVSHFLIKKQESIKTTLARQLCKTLGSMNIDVDTTDASTLSKLKTTIDELSMSVTDSTCLRSLKPLMEILESLDADGEDDHDDESTETEDDSDDESSLAEALEAIASMEATEKENATGKQVVSVEKDDGKGSSKSTRGRRRLASMN